eukprot:Amastigsp_a846731_39.p4 type:complete len:127 gc:universal Amastigsp_a846731_39:711-331(-)
MHGRRPSGLALHVPRDVRGHRNDRGSRGHFQPSVRDQPDRHQERHPRRHGRSLPRRHLRGRQPVDSDHVRPGRELLPRRRGGSAPPLAPRRQGHGGVPPHLWARRRRNSRAERLCPPRRKLRRRHP